MRILHTSDWQIGMKAGSVGAQAECVREERLAAARRVVQAAIEHHADTLLLAGDAFEDNAVDRLLVRKVGEILGAFPGPVFLLPGNHDPLVPGSVWDHPVWNEFPQLKVLRESAPLSHDGFALFPCPLREKFSTQDPTDWIDAHATRPIAIGLAHGNVQGLPGGEPDFPIPRDAASRRGLDYLALGHWHSTALYPDADGAPRMAYSGTHETTKFGERDSGNALLITLAERHAPPQITTLETGRLSWRQEARTSRRPGSIAEVVAELSRLAAPERTLLRLEVEGLLYAEDRQALIQLEEIIAGRFLFGHLDTRHLVPAPDDEGWIHQLPPGPFQQAAHQLRARATHPGSPDDQAAASRALLLLFELHARARP